MLRGRATARAELEREWRPVFMTSTTGRSSEPVPFLYTQYDIANMGLGSGRIVELGGVKPDERMINLFPFAPHLAFWYMYYGGLDRSIFALATGGGKVMGTEGCLRAIVKLTPQVLVAMPTFLYHVLQQALESVREIREAYGPALRVGEAPGIPGGLVARFRSPPNPARARDMPAAIISPRTGAAARKGATQGIVLVPRSLNRSLGG